MIPEIDIQPMINRVSEEATITNLILLLLIIGGSVMFFLREKRYYKIQDRQERIMDSYSNSIEKMKETLIVILDRTPRT